MFPQFLSGTPAEILETATAFSDVLIIWICKGMQLHFCLRDNFFFVQLHLHYFSWILFGMRELLTLCICISGVGHNKFRISRVAPVRFGYGLGVERVRAVPVFGSGGSCKEGVFVCFSTASQRGRFRFLGGSCRGATRGAQWFRVN